MENLPVFQIVHGPHRPEGIIVDAHGDHLTRQVSRMSSSMADTPLKLFVADERARVAPLGCRQVNEMRRRHQQQASRKMLQRRRMILKRRVPVSLARMAGITGFGKEAQVAQAQFPNQRPTGASIHRPGTPGAIHQRQPKQQQQDRQHGQGKVGIAQRRHAQSPASSGLVW